MPHSTRYIDKDYLLPFIGTKQPVRVEAVAVWGRNHVRIRSFPADKIIQRPHERSRRNNSKYTDKLIAPVSISVNPVGVKTRGRRLKA
jgi:hypothetical protein